MFNNSKYTIWYNHIIENANRQQRKKGDQYFERHHIIPKSLGGNNSNDNLVLLTAKEHFICHLLLPHMVISSIHKKSMVYAYIQLSKYKTKDQPRYNSNLYETHKQSFINAISGPNALLYGKTGKNHPASGPKSEEHKCKIGAASKRNMNTDEAKERTKNMGKANKGKHCSEEQKIVLSRLSRGANNAMFGTTRPQYVKDRVAEANSKTYRLQSPNGEITVTNIYKFCRENNLDPSGLWKTMTGKYKQHKGYVLLGEFDELNFLV